MSYRDRGTYRVMGAGSHKEVELEGTPGEGGFSQDPKVSGLQTTHMEAPSSWGWHVQG